MNDSANEGPRRRLYPTRPSHSADGVRQRQIEQIRAMSARERVELALALGRRDRLLSRALGRSTGQ
jgi:hypothetical protein